jgi:splicing factor 3A subunit 3
MDSVIEVQRQTHEEIEHFEKALYTVLSKPQPTHESRLQTEHKAAQILDRIAARGTTLHNLYQDQDSRKAEIDSLSGSGKADDLSAFYARLKKVQDHYLKYPDAVIGGFELELAAFLDEPEEEHDEEYAEEDRESVFH